MASAPFFRVLGTFSGSVFRRKKCLHKRKTGGVPVFCCMITLIITLPDEKIKAFEEKSTFFSKKIYVFRIISVFFLPEADTCTKNRFTPRWVQTGFFEALRLISCAFVLIRMCQIDQVLCPNDNSQSICDDFQYSEDYL
jgi:hypothetical protein